MSRAACVKSIPPWKAAISTSAEFIRIGIAAQVAALLTIATEPAAELAPPPVETGGDLVVHREIGLHDLAGELTEACSHPPGGTPRPM